MSAPRLEGEEKTKVISALGTLFTYFEDNYQLSASDVLSILQKKPDDVLIPLSIFKGELPGLEALVKYLKENVRLSNREIARLLIRSSKTIWASYHAAKPAKAFRPSASDLFLPVATFQKNKLSILESIVDWLKKRQYKNIQIARMLNKDPRTIWTVAKRIEQKQGTHEKQ